MFLTKVLQHSAEYLSVSQDKGLFSSAGFNANNLLFKDSTTELQRLPELTTAYIYLGAEYWNAFHSLRRGSIHTAQGETTRGP